jgi:hypothetical protein
MRGGFLMGFALQAKFLTTPLVLLFFYGSSTLWLEEVARREMDFTKLAGESP